MRYKMAAVLAVVATILYLCVSCAQAKYVEVPVSVHDTVVQVRAKTDSVVTYDSVYVLEKGDTVIRHEYKYVDRCRIKTDSVYISRIDTLTQIKEVSAELKWSDKVLSRIGKISLLIWILIAIAAFVYAYSKIRSVKH